MKAWIKQTVLRPENRVLVLVFLSAVSSIFANGRYAIPILAWVYPFLFLCLMKAIRSAKSILMIYLIFSVGFVIQWLEVLGMGLWLCIVIGLGLSGIKTLPYVLYRKLSQREDRFYITLLFPAAVVTAEYIIYRINSILAGLSDVYTQYQNLILMSFASLLGVYGVIFIMYWTAAVASWIYFHRNIKPFNRGISVYAAVMIVVFLYGVVMVNLPRAENTSVRVAGVTVPVKELLENDPDVSAVFYSDSFSEENLAATQEKLAAVHRELFQKTIEEAEAGAKIIMWSELNGAVMKDDEPLLIAQAAEVARERNIYLLISLLTKTPYETYKENKAIMITPEGNAVTDYLKTVRSFGELCIEGAGTMEAIQSEYGNLAAFICSDMASADMLRQTGKSVVDIILVPASDWEAMTPITIKTAIARGIENGASVVRQTKLLSKFASDHGFKRTKSCLMGSDGLRHRHREQKPHGHQYL